MKNDVKSHILQLQEASRQNRLVIFVGAGVSASAGVPIWSELINKFSSEVPEDVFDANDFLKSAQIYRELRGEVEYLKQIKKFLKDGQVCCNQVHNSIMQLNPCHIVTTNYDDLLEQAALNNNKQYYVVAKDSHLPANQGEKMLIKMHGDFRAGNIVLSENDYFDYSRNFPLIRSFLLSLFSTKVVLFIGFSFSDINLKYILREVSKELGENMQRVYMLVNDDKSPLAYNYFLKKGILVLNIPDVLSKEILDSQGIRDYNGELKDRRSIQLNQALQLINHYDPNFDDIIGTAIEFMEKYDDQIRFLGKHLISLFPIGKRSGFDISQGELTLPEKYKAWFTTLKTEKTNVANIKALYGSKYEWLIEKLHTNRIQRINGVPIFTKKEAEKLERERENNTTTLLYSLALDDLEKRVVRLKHRAHSYSIDDLEYPYILFKLGRYSDAYQEYRQLAPEFWKRRKYILYFIALYNSRALYGKVLWQGVGHRDFNLQQLQDEVNAINFRAILEDLPVEQYVKEIFSSLITGNMPMEDWIKATQLNDKLEEQRRNAERGGTSINGNVMELLDTFEQTFFFCNENYILTECNSHSQEANVMMVKGVLNSVLTPAGADGWQSKLDKLGGLNMILFVFLIKSEELQKVLNSLADKPIPVSTDFVSNLQVLVHNLVEDLQKKKEEDLIDPELAANYLKNIILLLNRIENAPKLDNVYQLIAQYWYKGRFIDFSNELLHLFERQSPSADEAVRLIDCALHSPTFERANMSNLIAKYAEIADAGNRYIGNEWLIEQLKQIEDVVLRATLYRALPDSNRAAFKKQIENDIGNLCELSLIEIRTGMHIISPTLVEKLKNTIEKDLRHHLCCEELTCSILHKLSKNPNYLDVQDALSNLKEVSECYRFMEDPIHYAETGAIQGSWLMYLDDDELKILVERPQIRKIIKEYCDKTLWNEEFRMRVEKLLQIV